MKKILLILCFFSMGAQAIRVADCPKSIALEIHDFNFDYVFPDDFDERDLNGRDEDSCIYDCHNEPGMYSLQKKLTEVEAVQLKLQLVRAKDAVCHYRDESSKGQIQAKIKGSFRDGTSDKAVLMTYWQAAVFYTTLKSMKPGLIEATSPVTSLYYNGEYCSWGDCVSDHIRIGLAKSTHLEVLR